MNPDFVDLLRAFVAADVRFLVVGAYALAVHGRPRATGDLDLWVDPTPDNARRVMQALREFGAPVAEITEADFSRAGVTYQIGVEPGRIDGRQAFLRNKRATGRAKDLGDIEGLE